MHQLIRSAQSEQDLIDIWRYIAADKESAAFKLLEKIDWRIQELAKQPFIGEHQPLFGERTRRIIVGNYLVYYDVLPDAIHVLRVFHGARHIEDLFQ
jgi:toxin ParE1/3/4